MAADPFARLADRQQSLRTALRALKAAGPGSPDFQTLLTTTNAEVDAVMAARKDVEAARLTVPNRAIAAGTTAAALVVAVGWFDAWSLLSLLLAVATAASVLVDPTGRGVWEPRARTTAICAALAATLLTPVASGWAALVTVAGIAWWAWRTLR
ncbi:hypothetical protein SAMN04488564_108311 [Lentzea waywayandensis]|uniref:Uncharacterized protein n=1 Tax=Lentzea waywayandensis TaxID=84724 RepID=A0A1I6F5K9_9PSEU|nr:hypothetical protein [Lentzea waywayandensis]SFR25319.1 hypothetical protein SAMN04488564_108311 [Lentzea waywayandensis]